MANLYFVGIDSPVLSDLGKVLGDDGHQVTVADSDALSGADAVFCNGDSPDYKVLLTRIRRQWPYVPVVVVTRLPESDKWLDALDAGAADYCSAPFETIQVRWILSSVLGHGKKTMHCAA